MLGSNGGLLGKERLATVATLGAPGLWLPNEQSVARRAGRWPLGPTEVPNIGAAFLGGFFAGYISHTANGVATHALIVAPRATGASGTDYALTTNYTWKTSNTATAGTTSTFDGRANTDAMITAGITLHPAAQFCVNLTIGGFTDWYLPSRLELDIAYFHLKPNTTANVTGTGAGGVNSYSVPIRTSNYTSSIPGMTGVSAFNSTGAERFPAGAMHWTSTQAEATRPFNFQTDNGQVLYLNTFNTNTLAIRAFRRIAL